jgi:hypothetical protein
LKGGAGEAEEALLLEGGAGDDDFIPFHATFHEDAAGETGEFSGAAFFENVIVARESGRSGACTWPAKWRAVRGFGAHREVEVEWQEAPYKGDVEWVKFSQVTFLPREGGGRRLRRGGGGGGDGAVAPAARPAKQRRRAGAAAAEGAGAAAAAGGSAAAEGAGTAAAECVGGGEGGAEVAADGPALEK